MDPARHARRWAALSTLAASFLAFGGCGDAPGDGPDQAIVEPSEPLSAEDAAALGAEPAEAPAEEPAP